MLFTNSKENMIAMDCTGVKNKVLLLPKYFIEEDCEILMIWNSISAILCYTGILSVFIYKKNGICVS